MLVFVLSMIAWVQEAPPEREQPLQEKGGTTLQRVLEEMVEGLLHRPQEEESVLERVGELEKTIKEIEARPDSEKWQEDLDHAKEQLKALRGSGWWGATKGTLFVAPLLFRMESRSDVDPWLQDKSHDTLVHFRWGLGVQATLSESLRVEIAGKQSRSWDAQSSELRQQDDFDLEEARIDLRLYEGGIPLEVSLGRMDFSLGEERMVGEDDWINLARSFDGAKFFHRLWLGQPLHSAYGDLRLFWGRPVSITDDSFNRSDPDVNLYGFSADWVFENDSRLGMYVLYDNDAEHTTVGEAGSGARRISSLGLSFRHELLPVIEVGGEAVGQRGSFGDDSHRAWAVHSAVRLHQEGVYDFLGLDLFQEGITLEYNVASGDHDPDDGDHGTFFPPYPSPHGLHGMADLFGWRNLHHYGARWRIIFARQEGDPGIFSPGIFEIGVHSYALKEERDAYYGPRGEMVRRDVTGTASRDLGYEWDVGITLGGFLSLGYARFRAGSFFEDTGDADDGSLFLISIGGGY